MIDALDLVLRQTLVPAIPSLANRLGFQPPNDDWRQRVEGGTGVWLNCALVDLREDRHRRSTEIRIERDPLRRVHAPFLLRCHYLLSAWNSAKDSDAVAATELEHGLLGQVVSTLLEAVPLTPSTVLTPAELATLPANWRETGFDTDLMAPEGFPKLAEFWGTMGRQTPWRPCVWLIVTVPVEPVPTMIDGVVTTVRTGLGSGVPKPEFGESVLDVGGLVLDATGAHAATPVPVPDALITVADGAGRLLARATSTAGGRFVVTGIPPGSYQMSARASGFAPLPLVPLIVPSPAPGPVELRFT